MPRDRYVRLETLVENRKGLQCVGLDIGTPQRGLVVIKEAHAGIGLDANGIDARGRLKTEAHALRALQSCPRVPAFVDFWHETDRSFLVYRFVEGTNLASLLGEIANSGRTIPAEILLDWARSLWDCLFEVHSCGFVFGDLKPSNIVVDRNGDLSLIDFELAQAPGAGLHPGFGTRGYASAEQLAGKDALGVQDDVYAYGSTLLSMITMRDLGVFAEVNIEMICRDAFRRCPGLADLALKCRHANRDSRPTMVEIGRSLSRVRTARPRSSTSGKPNRFRSFLH
jgi:serine/threonine protein kinase